MVENKTKGYDTKALLETSIDLSKARDFDSIAEILFDFIKGIVPISMSVLYIIESDGQSLKPCACRGAKIENLQKRSIFKLGEGGVGYVGREKKAILLTDAQKSINIPIRIRQVDGEDPCIRSFLAVPLIVNNNLIGVLSASSSKPNRYTMHDVEIVSIVANQVAAIVELYGRMEDTQKFSDLILDNMNSGVIVTDNSGNIIMLNKTGELITGRRHMDVRGKSILRLRFLDNDTKIKIKECISGNKPLWETPGIVLHPKDEKIQIRMNSSRFLTSTNKNKGHIIILRDVRKIEHLQQRLSRFEKLTALGKWTSSISHEIRNSLLPIRTSVQLLKRKLEDNQVIPDIHDLLDVLYEESERLNRYLNQLTDFNKIDNHRNTVSTPLLPVLDEIVAILNTGLRENNINLQITDKIPCCLPFTKDQIKQMFLNLFLNSIDAFNPVSCKKDKHIKIEVHQEEKNTIIDFIDNGSGIRKEDLNNLFEPFFTTKSKGTGLGLYNIHNLMKSVGGKIQVDSNVNSGTIITLIFKKEGIINVS